MPLEATIDDPVAGPPDRLVERAPAKVNLALHVLRRNEDGYHALDSLVAFAACGDILAFEPGPSTALVLRGPTADQAGEVADNLVLRVARAAALRIPGLVSGRFTLVKRLPVAAGLGGGSADAGAALRLIARANGLDPTDPRLMAAAAETGADIPVCVAPRVRRMEGRGEILSPPIRLPALFAVLVNPRVPVSTPAVFGGLGVPKGGSHGTELDPLPDVLDRAGFLDWLVLQRNDLEAPAIAIAPDIAVAIARLSALPGCRLARMSGSGATVFGLFDDCRTTAHAAALLRAGAPDWWVVSTRLG